MMERVALGLRLLGTFLRERPSQFALSVVLAAFGILCATAILWLRDTIETHAARQAEGIDLVVGAKGSALQNVLAAIYHVDVPSGNIPLAEVEAIAARPDVAYAIPIALGDSVAGARIVGTTAAFLDLYGARAERGTRELAPMNALLGAQVARRTGLSVGDRFIGVHGLSGAGEAHDEHPYTVTGILAPTGRVVDQLVLTALESVWIVHEGHTAATEPEVSFALVGARGPAAMTTLPRALNARPNLQAAVPALEAARLLTAFAWVVALVQFFALVMLAAALASLVGALMQAVTRREPDLAMLQAVGARPWQLSLLLSLETLALVVFAALLAALTLAALPAVADRVAGTGLPWSAVDGISWFVLVVALTLLAALVATLPALRRALRVDVVEQLVRR